ncbi:MAG: hypothetical protein AAGC55_23265, partial [Myxococcota bacterium]
MTDYAITLRRDHLASHRRMIAARSMAAAIASALPIPLLDSRLCYLIQRGTLRKLAVDAQVDLDEGAALAIIYGQSEPPSWAQVGSGAVAFKLASRAWRKALMAYMAARRAQVAGRYFTIATLFDHYCAKLHVGIGLDHESGTQLRRIMDQAMAATPGGLGRHVFRRAAVSAARATVRAPLELLDIATQGRVRKLLSSRSEDEIAVAEEVETHLERQLRA